MSQLRPARFEGKLYPSQPESIGTRLETRASLPGLSRLLLGPHGALDASFPVVRALVPSLRNRNRWILLGPLHRNPGLPARLALDPRPRWEIFGAPVELLAPMDSLDQTPALKEARVWDPAAHDREHSLEFWVAICEALSRGGRYLPLALSPGRDWNLYQDLANVLAEALNLDDDLGLLVTSDLDHYLSEASGQISHRQVVEALDPSDPDALRTLVETGATLACGGPGIWIYLEVAKQLGLSSEVLGYGWFGDLLAPEVGFVSARALPGNSS